jgi:putative membrane protein
MMGGWMMLQWVVGATVLVGLVVLAVLLFRQGAVVGPQETRSRARELLDQRFARGEINEDEYLSRLSVLDGQPPKPLG